MGFTLFPSTAGLTGLIVAATAITLPLMAPVQAQGAAGVVAQASGGASGPTGCRITRDQIGIYQEPNVSEAAVGILAEEMTITLGTGSGNGWARIVAPQTGWVQAKFLRGNAATPCPAGSKPTAAAPVESVTPPSAETHNNGTAVADTTPAGESEPLVSRAVCAVLPDGGLIVRDQPNLANSRVIGAIRPGNYTFQFTRDRQVVSERQWAYITAPAKGWVSTGIVGGGSNLSGEGCS